MRKLFFFYELLLRILTRSFLLNWIGVGAQIGEQRREAFRTQKWRQAPFSPPTQKTTWFHAASVGELEMLIPLIEEFSKRGESVGVSVFSESAIPALNRLPQELSSLFVYAGFSPPDFSWRELLTHFRVTRVFVSKYEAWPGLWVACSDLNLPLIMLNAQVRRSITFARRFLKFFQIPLPRLYFYALSQTNADHLQSEFPSARVSVSADPRWIRVQNRAKNIHSNPALETRLDKWKAKAQSLPRPFLFIGSAWIEDLEQVLPALQNARSKREIGTIWIVPHSLEPKNLEAIEKFSSASSVSSSIVIVPEMGLLLELYSLADLVWVGGGYGKGIHSVLEPAMFTRSIACGPRRTDEFFEAIELERQGILKICRHSKEIQKWIESFRYSPTRSPQLFSFPAVPFDSSEFSQKVDEWVLIR